MADNVPGEVSGIALPFSVSHDGGIKLMRGDELISQYVKVYCGDWENDNPFNVGGISPAPIFEPVSDTGWKSIVRRQVTQAFANYLNRTNLAELIDISFTHEAEGESTMDVRFKSIESDEELALSVPLEG